MKKIINIILKIVLSLVLLLPVMGVLRIFPEATADLYNTPQAFAFIQMLAGSAAYIDYIIAIVFVLSLILIWTNRMALAAILILPIVVNIIGFHLFLDGGLFTPGAIPAIIILALNFYFLWQQRANYIPLLNKTN